LPERGTVHGFYARILPHWAHVWYYRYVHGSPFAGRPGYVPYPTYYHPVIGCDQLTGFLAGRGVNVLACFGDGFKREDQGLKKILVRGFAKLTALLSFGTLTAEYKDLLYIAVKADPALARS
jgi:hypothetical protein